MSHDWWLIQARADRVPLAAVPLYLQAVEYVERTGLRDVEIVRVRVTFGAALQWSVGKAGPWVREADA